MTNVETPLPTVEHPADYRKDARLVGNLSVSQVAGATLAVIGGCLLELYLSLTAAPGGLHLLGWLLTAATVLQITWGLTRRVNLVLQYGCRPRERQADASRPVTATSEDTLQDLIKVQASEGTMATFLDGSLAVFLEIRPGPTRCLSSEQQARLCRRLEQTLLNLSETGVEMTVYADLDPDLNRAEVDRQTELLAAWPEASGLRRLVGMRMEHHWWLAEQEARRSTYHVRLTLRPERLPLAREQETPEERMERALDYLRRVGQNVAEELGGEGTRVIPLSPEGLRDLAARQLDPAGWRQVEPVAGTAWRWPVGAAGPSAADAPAEEAETDVPPMQTAAPANLPPAAPVLVEPSPQPPEPVEVVKAPAVPTDETEGLPDEWPWKVVETVVRRPAPTLSAHGHPIGCYPRRPVYRTPTAGGMSR